MANGAGAIEEVLARVISRSRQMNFVAWVVALGPHCSPHRLAIVGARDKPLGQEQLFPGCTRTEERR